MIDSIQGSSSFQGISQIRRPQQLTDDQKSQIQSILSEYDADNVTSEDAESIFNAFKEAGIKPGPGMKEAIESAGFDAEELRSLAFPNGQNGQDGAPPPPPPDGAQGAQGSQSVSLSSLQSLQSILSQYDLSNLSSDDQESLLEQLNSAGLMKNGYTINLSA